MKTFYSAMLRHSSLKSLLIVIAALFAGFQANAQLNIVDLELDKEYSGTWFDDAFYKFVAPKDGQLRVSCFGQMVTFFTDQNFTDQLSDGFDQQFMDDGSQLVTILVKKDVVYWMCIRGALSDWRFTATMTEDTSVKFTKTVPSYEDPFSLGGTGTLWVYFNTPVTFETAYVQCGATYVELELNAPNLDHVPFELKTTLMDWLDTGVLKEGDKFTVGLKGVKSRQDPTLVYQQEGLAPGEFKLELTSAGVPTMMVSSSMPDTFLSYFPDNGKDGIAVLTYDKPLSTNFTPIATLGYGNPEGEYYEEDLTSQGKVSIEGNSVIVDFRGKLRTPATMLPAAPANYSTIKLYVGEIKDIDDNYVFAKGQGTFGSFSTALSYKEITYDLTTEFLPASGSSLQGVDEIELWMNTPYAVSFDGIAVTFRNPDGSRDWVEYTKEQCRVSYDNEEVLLYIPVTPAMVAGSNVTVNLLNPISLDGADHPVEAVYNVKDQVIPVAISPANDSKVETLDEITLTYKYAVKVADNAIAAVYTANGREELASAKIVATDDAKVVKIVLDEPLTEPNVYRVIVNENVITCDELGDFNEAFSLVYTIAAPVVKGWVFDPAEGEVASLSEIKVTNIDGIQLSWNYDATLTKGGKVVAFSSKKNGYYDVTPESLAEPITEMWITLQDPATYQPVTITEQGTYVLTLPAGFFNLGADGYTVVDSDEITVTYVIGQSGIADFVAEQPQGVVVYNLRGVQLINSADASAVETLPAGLYIINGKKVYIAK